MYQKRQLIRLETQSMIFLIEEVKMINEKHIQLCLAHQFGGINTIEFTQSLYAIRKKEHMNIETLQPAN